MYTFHIHRVYVCEHTGCEGRHGGEIAVEIEARGIPIVVVEVVGEGKRGPAVEIKLEPHVEPASSRVLAGDVAELALESERRGAAFRGGVCD